MLKVSIILKGRVKEIREVMPSAQAQSPDELIAWSESIETISYLSYVHRMEFKSCIKDDSRGLAPAWEASGDLLCFVDKSLLDVGFFRFWTSMFDFNPSMYAIGPGVLMISRKDFISCGGFTSKLESELLKRERIRVECAEFITPLSYTSLLSELGISGCIS